jgi:hypothetical protein
LGRNGFSLATFENKSGQKVGKWPLFRHFSALFSCKNLKISGQFQIKSGQMASF